MKRAGFTLIEMMVSITILSVMLIFLYESYANLNRSNSVYEKEVISLESAQAKKKVIYKDFSLILADQNATIKNENPKEDVVSFQTSHSIHKRYDPYVMYLIKDKKLYRLESRKALSYPIETDSEFDVDIFGEVKTFRVYEAKVEKSLASKFLVNIEFENEEEILLKIHGLNEY